MQLVMVILIPQITAVVLFEWRNGVGEVTARNQVIHVDKTEINIFGPGVTT